MSRWVLGFVVVLAVAAGVVGFTGRLSAADADPAEEQARKLNDLDSTAKMQERLNALLKDKEAARKLVRAAARLQKAAGPKDRPFNPNAAVVLARLAHALKEYDAAELFYAYAAEEAADKKQWERTVQAYTGLFDLFAERRNYPALEDAARKFMDLQGGRAVEEAKPLAAERLIQAQARQGDIDEALRKAETLAQLDRTGWYFLQLKGWVQREAGKTAEAIATYKEVLTRLDDAKGISDDTRAGLKRNVRYLLAGLYEEKNDVDQATEILQKLLKEEPDSATYCNDLGFIWADHDRNLDEAEKLIRKALELDAKRRQKLLEEGKIDADAAKKESGAYLDSLGWVLFKKKKYDEALPLLEKAVADEGDTPSLEKWDHLGDCDLALGRKKEAAEAWARGLKCEDASRADAVRRKKVTAKMNKLKAELK